MAKAPTATATTKTAALAETKAAKFVRIGNMRVNKALDAIANIEGLANKNNYDYTPEQATAMLKALEAQVVKLAGKFQNPGAAVTSGFDLSAVKPAEPAPAAE